MKRINKTVALYSILNYTEYQNAKVLAEKLGVTRRMVAYIVTDLKDLGVNIDCKTGKNGGVKLLSQFKKFEELNININELESLKKLVNNEKITEEENMYNISLYKKLEKLFIEGI